MVDCECLIKRWFFVVIDPQDFEEAPLQNTSIESVSTSQLPDIGNPLRVLK